MDSIDKTTQEIELAKRVLSLRKMTRLSRRAFAKRYGVAPGTLQNWEDVQGNGLTEKGARRLINALQSSGIYCSIEWLMQGLGAGPRTDTELSIAQSPYSTLQEQDYISEELALFYQHYKEAIDCIIKDDGMWPQFKIGDHVAGVRHYASNITSLIGQECIIMTVDGELLVRELRASELPDHYTLVCNNSRTQVAKPIIYDIKLVWAAPVIWLRRLHHKLRK
jgi:transcriptional regulator with XRE-family HTH domain